MKHSNICQNSGKFINPSKGTATSTSYETKNNIINCDTTVSCQNKTTMYFTNDNQNNFLNCTQRPRKLENKDTENADVVSTGDSQKSGEPSVSSELMKKVSMVLALLEGTKNDKTSANTKDEKEMVADKGTSTSSNIENLEIVTRERQKQIRNHLEKLYEGALRVKSLEKIYVTFEPNEIDRNKRIENTIRKGKIDFLQKVNNFGKLATKSLTTIKKTEAGPSAVDNREKLIHYPVDRGTSIVYRALPVKMNDTTLLANGMQSIRKARNKIKNKIRTIRHFGLGGRRQCSSWSSLSEEEIDSAEQFRGIISNQDFNIFTTCLELKMDRPFHSPQIQVRQILSRMKVKSTIEHNLKRKVKVKKVKLTHIRMKKVQLINCNKIRDSVEAFHLSDLLCRLCTVKQILKRAMSKEEEATMNISFSKDIVSYRTLHPFTLISVNNHFKQLHMDSMSYMHFTERNFIHITLNHAIKCDRIRLEVQPIQVSHIDTDAIMLKSISFIGRFSKVSDNFGYLTHAPIGLLSSWIDIGSTKTSNEEGSQAFHFYSDSSPISDTLIENYEVPPLSESLSESRIDIVCNHKKSFNDKLLSEDIIQEIEQEIKTTNSAVAQDTENVTMEPHLSETIITSISKSHEEIETETPDLNLYEEFREPSLEINLGKQELPKVTSDAIDTDKRTRTSSSIVAFDDASSKSMKTELKGRQFSFQKVELMFSVVGISAGDFSCYSDVSTGRSEEIQSTILQNMKKSSITLVNGEGMALKNPCSPYIQDIETLFENGREENDGVDRVDVLDENKTIESIEENKHVAISSCDESLDKSFVEIQNILKDVYQGVDPVFRINENLNSQFRGQPEDIFEAGKTMKVEDNVNEKDQSNPQDTRTTNDDTSDNTNKCSTEIDVILMNTDENPSGGTELIYEEMYANTFDSEAQRILDTYKHTLETLSECTEGSSSASTIQNHLAAILSSVMHIFTIHMSSCNLCVKNKFNFSDALQVTRDQITREFKSRVNKKDFQFQLPPIQFKVESKIYIHTSEHCYTPKPFLVSKKQRKESDVTKKRKTSQKSDRARKTADIRQEKSSNEASNLEVKQTYNFSDIYKSTLDLNMQLSRDQISGIKNDGSFEETIITQTKQVKPFTKPREASPLTFRKSTTGTRSPHSKRSEARIPLMHSKVVSVIITETSMDLDSHALKLTTQDKVKTVFSSEKNLSSQYETESNQIKNTVPENIIKKITQELACKTKTETKPLQEKSDSKCQIKHDDLQSNVDINREQKNDTFSPELPVDQAPLNQIESVENQIESPSIEVILHPADSKLKSSTANSDENPKKQPDRLKKTTKYSKRRKLRSMNVLKAKEPKLTLSITESLTIKSETRVDTPRPWSGKQVKERWNKSQRMRQSFIKKRKLSKTRRSRGSRPANSPTLLENSIKFLKNYDSEIERDIKSSIFDSDRVPSTDNIHSFRNKNDINNCSTENCEYSRNDRCDYSIKSKAEAYNLFVNSDSTLSYHNLHNISIIDDDNLLLTDITEPPLDHTISDPLFNINSSTDISKVRTIEKEVSNGDTNNDVEKHNDTENHHFANGIKVEQKCLNSTSDLNQCTISNRIFSEPSIDFENILPTNSNDQASYNIGSFAKTRMLNNNNKVQMNNDETSSNAMSCLQSRSSKYSDEGQKQSTSSIPDDSTIICTDCASDNNSQTQVRRITFQLPTPRQRPNSAKKKLRPRNLKAKVRPVLPRGVKDNANRTFSADSIKTMKSTKDRRRIPLRVATYDPAHPATSNKSTVTLQNKSQKSLAVASMSYTERDRQYALRRFDILNKMRQSRKRAYKSLENNN